MGARHFDRLVRALSEAGTRRGLLGLLATLPILGGLIALMADGEETDAKGRRKRRKKRHKHGRPRSHGTRKKKKCKPKSKAKTCAGTCGPVKNNCQKTVDCGSCGCATNAECGDGALCLEDGSCQACDVVCQGLPAECGSALQTALLDGGTIYVCPGAYRGGFNVSENVTVIGAGQGDDPTVNTILDGGQQDRVVVIDTGVAVTLQGLCITGGQVTDDDGAGIFNLGQLTMTDCTVTANHAVAGQIGFGTGGGIRNFPSANLTMTNCTISQNSAALRAGGILLLQGTHTLTNCTFTGNTAGLQGGALFCNNGGATTLIGCTIGPGNDASAGAIVVQNSSAVTLDATSVTGNTGTTVGGISSASGVVTLQNGSTVSGNSPNNCVGPITGPGCAP